MKIQELCQQFIKSAMSLFELMLVPEAYFKWTTFIQQSCKLDGYVTSSKNSLGSKVIGHNVDALKVKDATTLKQAHMWYCLEKLQGLMLTLMQCTTWS